MWPGPPGAPVSEPGVVPGTWHPALPAPALLPEEDAHFSPCHCNLIKPVFVQRSLRSLPSPRRRRQTAESPTISDRKGEGVGGVKIKIH